MESKNRRKSPVDSRKHVISESKNSNFFQECTKTANAYVEVESTPWFDVNCCDDEKQQIDNYISKRFNEFQDSELLEFLRNNAKYRKIVSNVRKVYIETDIVARFKKLTAAKGNKAPSMRTKKAA